MSGATIHASCVAIEGRAVLITGASGSGKSDLALRLIDRGAALVSDDYTEVTPSGERLLANAPATIKGKIEVRGLGILEVPAAHPTPVALVVDIDSAPERLPQIRQREIAGIPIPLVALAALEASAPIKLERALQLYGIPLP